MVGQQLYTERLSLFFSWHDTVMRYYRGYLDNVGPNSQDISSPQNYRGVISQLVSYPGMLVASIDAGDNGYSTVNAYNGSGWCNLFTAPATGDADTEHSHTVHTRKRSR